MAGLGLFGHAGKCDGTDMSGIFGGLVRPLSGVFRNIKIAGVKQRQEKESKNGNILQEITERQRYPRSGS